MENYSQKYAALREAAENKIEKAAIEEGTLVVPAVLGGVEMLVDGLQIKAIRSGLVYADYQKFPLSISRLDSPVLFTIADMLC